MIASRRLRKSNKQQKLRFEHEPNDRILGNRSQPPQIQVTVSAIRPDVFAYSDRMVFVRERTFFVRVSVGKTVGVIVRTI